jgi:hypothetical protein
MFWQEPLVVLCVVDKVGPLQTGEKYEINFSRSCIDAGQHTSLCAVLMLRGTWPMPNPTRRGYVRRPMPKLLQEPAGTMHEERQLQNPQP